jgi:hypothetical protein
MRPELEVYLMWLFWIMLFGTGHPHQVLPKKLADP